MLKTADMKGAIMTADAGFSSGNLPADIKNAKADYVLRVKDNTPKLKETMRLRVAQQGKRRGLTATETVTSGGYCDERSVTILPAAALQRSLPHGMRHAEQFGVITKKSTHKRTGKTTESEQFFITSCNEQQAKAQDLLRMH